MVRFGERSLSSVDMGRRPRVPPLRDPVIRGYAVQALVVAVLAVVLYVGFSIAIENINQKHMRTDFGFLSEPAGFDINQTLIPFSSKAGSTNLDAFWVGLLNTLLLSALGIVLATVIGFSVGIARLSGNWMVQRLATVYVEGLRNIPLLLQLLFWYNVVLLPLPEVRQSISIFGSVFLNKRGIRFPLPVFTQGAWLMLAALAAAVVGAIAYRLYARDLQRRTGAQSPSGLVALALVLGLPLLAYFAAGRPVQFDMPVLNKFNIAGGAPVTPEFFAMLLGLSLYTASFIAEVVRAGIQSVSHGQTEAAYALGLRPSRALDLIVVPQAMRVIIPPLTSQYLNLTKNSSLSVFIGYADLFNVFSGSVREKSSAPLQVVAMTMLVYLTISLATSLLMNIYNSRNALVER